MKVHLVLGSSVAALLIASPAAATCPDSDCSTTAKTILVRQSCTGLSNCFESVSKLSGKTDASCLSNAQTTQAPSSFPYGTLQMSGSDCTTSGWLWGARHPGQNDRVVVDVGPGSFESFVCPGSPGGQGHVAIRGTGRDQTKFKSLLVLGGAGMDIFGCDELVVSELTAEGADYGVRWTGGGEGAWSRVDMVASRPTPITQLSAGWVDICYPFYPVSGSALSRQIVSDSRAIVSGATQKGYAYMSDCAETYFFGGQMASTFTGPGSSAGLAIGTGVHPPNGEAPRMFVFGSQIISQPAGVTGTSTLVVGINAQGNALVHIEDSSIRATGNVTPPGSATVIGIFTTSGGKIERLGTTVDATTTSGTAVEVQNY